MIRYLFFRVVCGIGFHLYRRVELRPGVRQRGVTGRRVCDVCGNEQIRKPWYKNMLNWGGWCDV